jgi:hypothetical protein
MQEKCQKIILSINKEKEITELEKELKKLQIQEQEAQIQIPPK